MRALSVSVLSVRTAGLALAAAALALSTPAGSAQAADAGTVIVVDYANPGLTPAHWVLRISPDGSGHFRSERGNAQVDVAEGFEPANVDRDIRVSAEFAGHVFQLAHRHNLFNAPCESHLKVAFQGWKKVSYSGPEGSGACTFNYSKDKEMQWLGESMVATAGTIVEGARLETLLQHDRLGLDREMEFMMDAAKDGRLMEFSTIREILERLAADPEVLDRVRKRARTLLTRADG
jgi:hypothetical protein